MDLATLLGLVGAFAVIAVAILLGGPPNIFLNPPSLLIVLGGTAMTVLIKFNFAQFLGSFRVAFKAFRTHPKNPEELIPELVEIASTARKKGLLALEEVEADYPFLASALELASEGRDPDETINLLKKRKQETSERQKMGSQVFTASGDVAPAMGMIGTLIGLVQMLSNMDDPKTIGPAMAVALLTTLYGAIMANMVFMPVADKLKLRRIEEEKLNAICVDGLHGILNGQNARTLETTLKIYLNPGNQNNADDQNAAAAEETTGLEQAA